MFFNVADLKDQNDPQGRTYREVNAEKQHAIPLGALVELETGERLRVMMKTRDCDQTPLYSLGLTGDDEIDRLKWRHGYCDESLTVLGGIYKEFSVGEIEIWQVHGDGGNEYNTGPVIAYCSTKEQADQVAKGRGWYGGKGHVQSRAALRIDGKVWLLAERYPIDMMTPNVK